jgi:hypothetical protein
MNNPELKLRIPCREMQQAISENQFDLNEKLCLESLDIYPLSQGRWRWWASQRGMLHQMQRRQTEIRQDCWGGRQDKAIASIMALNGEAHSGQLHVFQAQLATRLGLETFALDLFAARLQVPEARF